MANIAINYKCHAYSQLFVHQLPCYRGIVTIALQAIECNANAIVSKYKDFLVMQVSFPCLINTLLAKGYSDNVPAGTMTLPRGCTEENKNATRVCIA
jgi:hypothetical protein